MSSGVSVRARKGNKSTLQTMNLAKNWLISVHKIGNKFLKFEFSKFFFQ